MLRAPLRARVRPGPAVILEFACLSLVPCIIVNDSQRFHLLADPLILSLNLRHLPAGSLVFFLARPVKAQHPAIDLVMQDAARALPVTDDGRDIPTSTARTGSTFAIEGRRYRMRADAADIFAVDAPHDVGSSLVDFPQAADWLTSSWKDSGKAARGRV